MKLRNKKTGEIQEWECLGFYNPETESWEDYEPKEPLIKNEKVRKAVRAWAEANKTITKVYVMNNGYEIYGGKTDSVINFETLPFDHIEQGVYTIKELCGDEE